MKMHAWIKNIFSKLFNFLAIFGLSFQALSSAELDTSKTIPSEKGQKKLCLTMIVKNESRIIRRCLDSVKDIVDCISICDTGSSDETVKIIEDYLKEHNIKGKVHQHVWKNFGHNRSLSADAAKKTLQELGFSLENTYLLLIDADMVLEVSKDFTKDSLVADGYLLQQVNIWMAYYNMRIVKASLPWHCVGVTHEYWSCKTHATQDQLHTLTIDDREDGGAKADKFERDIRLLTEGIAEEPQNERYMFYLAQSYRCVRNYDEAIKWYKERIKIGGWIEEIYYSKFMIGEMYEEMGEWDQALHWYLDAYQTIPERAEPLHKIATHYRKNNQHNLAYLYAKQGSCIPYPREHLLFVSHPVYDYQFDEELAISAFYTPNRSEGFVASNRLCLSKKVPSHLKETNARNIVYYVAPLKATKVVPLDIKLPKLYEESTETYNPMNPTIQRTDDGYLVICRTVNWAQRNGKEYFSRDPNDADIRARNYLLRYDPWMRLLSQQEIVEDLPRERLPTRIHGLEDNRLIESDQNYVWILSTTFDTHPGAPGQSLCQIPTKPHASGALYVEKLIPIKGPVPGRCEKNWLPFVHNGELLAIYEYSPLTILKIDRKTGETTTVKNVDTLHDFSKFRGSAAPITFNDGYLLLVHEVVFGNEYERTYLHRFVFLDKNFDITKVSKPFVFFHKGIEYSCGMTLDHSQKQCILTVGNEDKEAYFVYVDVDHINSILEPLPTGK